MGGEDVVNGGSGDDIIIGGTMHNYSSANTQNRGNILNGDQGDDIVIGTNGFITRDNAQVVLRIETLFPEWGSNDRINVGEGLRPTASRGSDILIGGTGDDIIHGGWESVSNILIGDNAVVVRADGSSEANDLWTKDPTWGGSDILIGGPVGDIILGGSGNSDLTGGLNLTGTFRFQNGVLTVTTSNHGLLVNQIAFFDFNSEEANDGLFRVTSVVGDTLTLQALSQSWVGMDLPVMPNSPTAGDVILRRGGDVISGGRGDDTMTGDGAYIERNASDTILRLRSQDADRGGNDLIDLFGNRGNDILVGGHGDDRLMGGTMDDGRDLIFGGWALLDYTTYRNVSIDVVVPNERILFANALSTDPLFGGNNWIDGGTGTNLISGGPGNDTITAGAGNSVLVGDMAFFERNIFNKLSMVHSVHPEAGGDDLIIGNIGNDLIIGGAGNDYIDGDEGNDSIFGDHGSAIYYRESARDGDLFSLYPDNGGADTIFGGHGVDWIFGGSGGLDQAAPALLQNRFVTVDDFGYVTREGGYGVSGDIIYSTPSQLDGGLRPTTDEIVFGDNGYVRQSLTGEVSFLTTREWIAEIDSTRTYLAYPTNSNVGQIGQAWFRSALIEATPLANGRLDWENFGGNDVINWGAGNSGKEILFGGFGNDILDGGVAGDIILGDNGEVRSIGGQYIVEGIRSTYVGSGGHDLIYGGANDDILMGGPGDDLLVGDTGNDHLWGDGGSDLLWGGLEVHPWIEFRVLEGETIADKFELPPGWAGADANNPTGYNPPLITAKILNGQPLSGSVVDGDNILRGGFGDDIIFGGGRDADADGGPGNDYVDGGAGNNLLTGGGGDDVIIGGDNDDTIRGDFAYLGSYDSIFPWMKVGDVGTPAASFEYFIYRGFYTGRDQVYGGGGNDNLFGDGGASDVITFSGSSITRVTAAKLQNPDLGYGAALFAFDGSNNDIELRANVATTDFYGWTITFHDVVEDFDGVQVEFDHELKTYDIYIREGVTNAADVQEAITNTPSSPFQAYAYYRGPNALPFSDHGDGEGSQLGQTLLGQAGADKLYAWAPDDQPEQYNKFGTILRGGSGNDQLYGNIRKDWLFGDTGDDYLHGDALIGPDYGFNERGEGDGPMEIGGGDLMFGGSGEDRLLGGGGDDEMWGGAGSDWLEGGNGMDTSYGGTGIDIILLDSKPYFTVVGETVDGFYGNEFRNDILNDNATDILLVEGTDFNDRILFTEETTLLSSIPQAITDSLFSFKQTFTLTLQSAVGGSVLTGTITVDSNGDINTLVSNINSAIETSETLSGKIQAVTRGETIAFITRGYGADATLMLSDFTDGEANRNGLTDIGFTEDQLGVGQMVVDYAQYVMVNGQMDIVNPRVILLSWKDAAGEPKIEQVRLSGLGGDDILGFVAGVNALDVSGLTARSRDWVSTFDGGAGNDIIFGSDGRDQIFGGFGSDTIYGNGGDDILWADGPAAGSPDDVNIIYGGQGNDDILGGKGTNFLYTWSDDPNRGGPNDPSVGQLHFVDGQTLAVFPTAPELHLPLGDPLRVLSYTAGNDILRLVGGEDLPQDGRLNNDARFAIFLGDDADPVEMLVEAEDTVDFTSIGELIGLINNAMRQGSLADGRVVDLTKAVVASAQGNRLSFTTTGTLVSMTAISNGGLFGLTGNVSGLGAVVGQSALAFTDGLETDTSDVVLDITFNDGQVHRLTLGYELVATFTTADEWVYELNRALASAKDSAGVPLQLDYFVEFDATTNGKLELNSRIDSLQIVNRNDVLRIVGTADAPITGNLSTDAYFTLIVGADGEPIDVKVPFTSTRANLTIDMLVNDLNEALAAATLPDGSNANLDLVVKAVREGNRVVLETAGTLLQLESGTGDAFIDDLRFSESMSGRGMIESTGVAPTDGQLSKELNVTVRLNGGRAYAISLDAADTAENETLSDLVDQLNAQLATVRDSDDSLVRLEQYVRFGETANGRVTVTALTNSIQFISQFGIFVDPDSGQLRNNDGGGRYELEDTGLNRVLGGVYDDSLYGGTGLDFLYGNGGDDILWRSDGSTMDSVDGGLADDGWKQYAKETDKVWYYGGTNADDVISVDYVTEPGLLGGTHLITRLTNNNGNFTFDAQVKLNFSATNASGDPLYNDLPAGTLPPEDDFLAIIIDALGGDDIINIGPTVQVSIWTDAGAGNDVVNTMSGNSILPDKTEQGGRNDSPESAYSLGRAWLLGEQAPNALNFRLTPAVGGGAPSFELRVNGQSPLTLELSGTQNNTEVGDAGRSEPSISQCGSEWTSCGNDSGRSSCHRSNTGQ